MTNSQYPYGGTDPYAGQPQQPSPYQQFPGVQPPAPEPKKSRKGLVIGAIVVALLGIFGVVNALGDDGGKDPVVSVPKTSTEEPADEPTQDAEPAAEETEEPEPTEEPAADEPDGSVKNPGLIGENFVTSEMYETGAVLTSTPVEVEWDATSIVMAENMFNDEPEDGFKYVMVTVEFAYEGDGSVDPFFEVNVTWLKDGRTYDEAWAVIPNDASAIGDLYDGGTASGTFAALLPEDADASNTLIGLSSGWGDEPLWFTAAGK